MTAIDSSRPVRPRRSVLYVPASNAKALAKVRSLACDAVILDLEDAVMPADKGPAREALRRFFAEGDFGGKEMIIRVNGLQTAWFGEDFLAARACRPHAILIPKVDEPDDIASVADALQQTDAPSDLRLWAMIETPRGVMNAGQIARHARTQGSLLDCFVTGTNDLIKETGALQMPGRPYLSTWLMQILLAGKAYGLDVIDGVYNDFRDSDGFLAECRDGRAMGFEGKTLIHPGQIAEANRIFGIDPARLAEAEAIVAAFALPENAGLGVIGIDGRMVERLHADMAQDLIEKARRIAVLDGSPTETQA
ncbi:citrate lyase subunit beta/citryl-CoA lyase [Hoeflea marina]|uniref:Citrate lyase subunit beta/citryl-CoA lyase n=1 Tax=Hoeflea marina TaxID=274592 RepID=A0A317PJF4_9HYPH|nr:CoA ester lyase [Hoeflea marina]PWW00592.1 citrate lyase subunit beta/citryl-CoA lyase [Hoeflea marina]